MPIVSNESCKKMFFRAGRHEVIPHIFMCAGYDNGGRDSCQVKELKERTTRDVSIPTENILFVNFCLRNREKQFFTVRIHISDSDSDLFWDRSSSMSASNGAGSAILGDNSWFFLPPAPA